MDAPTSPATGLSTRLAMPPRIAIPWGILMIALGSTPILALFGVIRVRPDSFHVPPWLVVLFSACFPAGGAFLLLHGLAGLFEGASRVSRLLTWLGNFFVLLLAISFFGGMAVFLNWQLILSAPDATWIAVLLYDAFMLFVLWHAVKGAASRSRTKQDGGPV